MRRRRGLQQNTTTPNLNFVRASELGVAAMSHNMLDGYLTPRRNTTAKRVNWVDDVEEDCREINQLLNNCVRIDHNDLYYE